MARNKVLTEPISRRLSEEVERGVASLELVRGNDNLNAVLGRMDGWKRKHVWAGSEYSAQWGFVKEEHK